MSTYIYLKCVSHDPPLRAEWESGQHLYDLPQLRTDVANREVLIAGAKLGSWPEERFSDNTLRFMIDHPTCNLAIYDEYGEDHPLVEPEEE